MATEEGADCTTHTAVILRTVKGLAAWDVECSTWYSPITTAYTW